MQNSRTYQDNTVIDRILSTTRTIAVVGLSSQPEKAGYYVPEYLQSQGYKIIPVNPTLEQALGEKSYPDLLAVPVPVDLVLIFRRSEAVPPFVDQAIQIGAKAVWMQLDIFNAEAAQKAEEAGLDVVMNLCMMVEHRRRKGAMG
jgi:predicted CoA-binding protein